MKNGDLPITPILNENNTPRAMDNIPLNKSSCIGLTKREYFAGLAMQGLLAGQLGSGNVENVVKLSIKYTDELLTQLDK